MSVEFPQTLSRVYVPLSNGAIVKERESQQVPNTISVKNSSQSILSPGRYWKQILRKFLCFIYAAVCFKLGRTA